MLIILTCLEEVPDAAIIKYSNIVRWAKDIVEILYSLLGVFHGEKGCQVGGVGWYPYEDTEPITAGKNTT